MIFDFPNDLLLVIALIIFPLEDTLMYYIPKYYMEYNYYSPFFIVFLIGIIYTILSLILIILLIFKIVKCGNTKICDLLI